MNYERIVYQLFRAWALIIHNPKLNLLQFLVFACESVHEGYEEGYVSVAEFFVQFVSAHCAHSIFECGLRAVVEVRSREGYVA